jgi:hypothetical protein
MQEARLTCQVMHCSYKVYIIKESEILVIGEDKFNDKQDLVLGDSE